MFIQSLQTGIKEKNSRLCVGLDPRVESLPEEITKPFFVKHGETLLAATAAIIQFNKEIIDIVAPHVAIVKPQSAFFEQYGPLGSVALMETIQYAHKKGLLVLLDAKRGDIDSTAQAYANAYLGKTKIGAKEEFVYNVDAITINPFLGVDTLQPFVDSVKKYKKGIFVLVKTSNPGSSDFQDLKTDSITLSERIAHIIATMANTERDTAVYSNIGAVVGATYPEDAKKLRALMPHSFFLVPGFGAQGGAVEHIHHFFNKKGTGAIVNSSRSILYAFAKNKEIPWRVAVEKEVISVNKIINDVVV